MRTHVEKPMEKEGAWSVGYSLDYEKNRQLAITMVKYDFCCSSINYWSNNLTSTQTHAIGYANIQ